MRSDSHIDVDLLQAELTVELENRSLKYIKVIEIAESRARYYEYDFEGGYAESLLQTINSFMDNPELIFDWVDLMLRWGELEKK